MSRLIAMQPATTTTTAEYIADLAREHGVRYRRSALDDYAEAVTRLAGDDVVLDRTEELLVALRQAGVITGIEATKLQARYLREISA